MVGDVLTRHPAVIFCNALAARAISAKTTLIPVVFMGGRRSSQ
jgi:hypothetical protein